MSCNPQPHPRLQHVSFPGIYTAVLSLGVILYACTVHCNIQFLLYLLWKIFMSLIQF